MKRNRPDGRQGERGHRGVEWRRRAEGVAARALVAAASRGRAYGSTSGLRGAIRAAYLRSVVGVVLNADLLSLPQEG